MFTTINISYFDHISTYAYLRSTLSDFNETRFMPVTVFTLCDTADNDGYGANYDSAAKIGSLLLQTIANNLNLQNKLSKENMSQLQTAYNGANRNENAASWKLLDQIMNQMNEFIEQNVDKPIDMSDYIPLASLSKVADLVGGQLNTANKKIASNVKSRLLDLYG